MAKGNSLMPVGNGRITKDAYYTVDEIEWDLTSLITQSDIDSAKKFLEEEFYENQEIEEMEIQDMLDNNEIDDADEYNRQYEGEFRCTDKEAFNQALLLKANKLQLPSRYTICFSAQDNKIVADRVKGILKNDFGIAPKSIGDIRQATKSEAKTCIIQDGITRMFDNGSVDKYFSLMQNFNNYAPSNKSLIFSQMPNATMVKGMKAWNELGAKVNEGERALQVFVNHENTKQIKDKTAFDDWKASVYYQKMIGKNRKQELENEFKQTGMIKEAPYGMYISIIGVFDVSQTNAREIGIDLVVNRRATTCYNDYSEMKEALLNVVKETTKAKIEERPSQIKKSAYDIKRNTISICKDLTEAEELIELAKVVSESMLAYKNDDFAIKGVFIKTTDPKQLAMEGRMSAYMILKDFGFKQEDLDILWQDTIKTLNADTEKSQFLRNSQFIEYSSRATYCYEAINNILEKTLDKNKNALTNDEQDEHDDR